MRTGAVGEQVELLLSRQGRRLPGAPRGCGRNAHLAVLLAQGLSVREVTASTGRKKSTIRSHVKHMFAKHGLSRQVELVWLVVSLAGAPEARC